MKHIVRIGDNNHKEIVVGRGGTEVGKNVCEVIVVGECVLLSQMKMKLFFYVASLFLSLNL